MAFEIVYHYYSKKETGYDVENPDTFSKKLGKQEDEVSLNDLASSVMKQLARRDILIFDVEVWEFVKKKITFKETKGGVILKNKKFLLDDNGSKLVEEVEDNNEAEVKPTQIVKIEKTSDNPIRFEVFDGDNTVAAALAKRNVVLTPKKRYPIFRERTVTQRFRDPSGMIQEIPGYNYLIEDDNGRKSEVSSMFFVPPRGRLSGPDPYEDRQDDSISLSHMSSSSDVNMPVLRR